MLLNPRGVMRILMFGWEFPPYNSGGLGTACAGLTKALAKRGHEILFVLPRHLPLKSDYMQFVFADDPRVSVTVINSLLTGYINVETYSFLRRALPPEIAKLYGNNIDEEVMRYAAKAAELAKTLDFDVIHAHDWLAYPAGLAAKAVSGKPLVSHLHATEFDRTGHGHVNQPVYDVERRGLHGSDMILAVSNYTKSIAVEKYGIDPARVMVVHNGVDPRDFVTLSGHRLKAYHPIVLFLGRLTLQKGPDWFLLAARRVLERRPDALFVIAGSGDMERQTVQQAAEMGLAENVIFAGFRRGQEIDRLYQIADVYIMPSVSEPFGITALEAVQQGTPVIVSKQSGVKEVLAGALEADFWDTLKMADLIVRLLDEPSAAHAIAAEQRACLPHCTWDAAAEKCEAAYKKVTSQ